MKCEACKKEFAVGQKIYTSYDRKIGINVCSKKCQRNYDNRIREQGDPFVEWVPRMYTMTVMSTNGAMVVDIAIKTVNKSQVVQIKVNLPGEVSADTVRCFYGAISKVVIAQEEIIPVSEDADSIVGEGEDEIEPVSKP